MNDVEIVVGIRGDNSGGRVIKRSLDEIGTASKQAANSNERLERQVRASTLATNGLVTAMSALGVAFGLRQLVEVADRYTVMEARLKSIGKTTQETGRLMDELRRISNETGSDMSTSLSVLQRLSFVREEIKATNNQMIQFTETVTKLGVVSGALPEAMKAGLTQLGQALSSQFVRAEEFNSIMENIPAVGKAIADELGVSTGQLRQLVVQGKLLSSDVFAAILNQTQQVRAEFQEFPKTATQGLKQMLNSLEQVIAQANNASGATNGIGIALRGVGEGAKIIYDGLGTTFDYLVAGIQEGVNLIDIALNKVKQSINDISKFIPGYDGTNFQVSPTLEVGSIFAAASSARKQREKGLFGDGSSGVEVSTRAVSQNYAKIAEGLNTNTAAKKAADKAEREAKTEQKRLQTELTSAINGSRTEQEKLNDEITHLEKLKGVATTTAQVDLLNRGIRTTQDELDKLAIKAELDSPLAKAFKGVADEVQDGFKDAFKGAFDGGGNLFKKFADGIRATFKSLLLDLAYQAAVRPIVISILGGVGGSLGLSSSAIASSLGVSGGTAGGSSIGGVGSIFSLGKSLLNGGVGTGLGNFAGQASSFLGGSFSQNLAVQKFFTNAGSFGNIAGGALGGIGANLLGLGSSNGFVNAGLGTIGGLAGSAFGPIGSFAGSFLGTALGGLFGGSKPSDMAQGGGINFATLERYSGGQTGKKYSAANANYRDTILNTIESVIKTIQGVGGSASGSANITIGSRDGLRYNGANFGNNSAAFNNAIFTDLKNSITGLDSTFQTILNKVGVTAPDNLAKAFEFGQQYKDTINPKTVADQLSDAIKVLDQNMNALIQTASELGLPLDAYTVALQKQKDAAIGALKAQSAGFSSFEQMKATFDDFFNSQALGATSSLTPMGKLQVAQSQFGDLLTKAQGGDLSVTPNLLDSANTLLGVGRDVYASGVDFSGLESFVRSSVSGIATQTGYTGQNVSYSIINTNKLVSDNVIEMAKQLEAMKAELFRLTNKLAVA